MWTKAYILATCIASTLAIPLVYNNSPAKTLSRRGVDCSNLGAELNSDDCNYMQSIGMFSRGGNSFSNNGNAWIGNDGPNTFTVSSPGASSILVLWIQTPGDYQSSFMNARQAAITMTVPQDQSVTVSIANGVSGAFTWLRKGDTTLTQYGQIGNTWGEFTTGGWATIDVSREVNMNGRNLAIRTNNGCVTDMNTCVFVCNNGATTCTTNFSLNNCDANTNPGATWGLSNGTPSGGCQGWTNGGQISVTLG